MILPIVENRKAKLYTCSASEDSFISSSRRHQQEDMTTKYFVSWVRTQFLLIYQDLRQNKMTLTSSHAESS